MDRNEIWAETEELAELLIQADEIQAFHKAETELKAHPQAQRMMNELRELQEQVADFQARRVPPKHFVHLLQQSESLMQELENIPEVAEFQRAQGAVNDLLQSVTNRLALAVTARVTNPELK